MRVKKELYPLPIIFLLFLILLYQLFLRPKKYLIITDDSIYTEFKTENLNKKNSDIKFVKKSEYKNNENLFRSRNIIAADLNLHESISYFPAPQFSREKRYILKNYSLLPSVSADFKNAGKAGSSLLSPDLTLNLSTVSQMPEGNRAITIENSYAGSSDYKLNVCKYASLFVYEDKVNDKIDKLCKKMFFPEEEIPNSTEKENKTDLKVKAENKDEEKEKTPPLKNETVTIASVGDIMTGRGVEEVLCSQDGIQKVFCDTLPILQQADFTLGNLEGVITESNSNMTKTFTFKFPKKILPKLLEAGFDYLMQTNNHCYDYGEEGFKDTLKAFEEYKIPSSGIGKNIEEAKKFYCTNIKDLPIAVISCGAFPVERSGFNGKKTATATQTRAGILWQSDELLQSVKSQKEAGYFVIVNVHGGEEYHFKPSKKQREFYQALCQNGADLVLGSHPHVLQDSEWCGKSLIVYSMGNFIFNGMEFMPGGTESKVVKIGVTEGRVSYVEEYPAKIGVNKVFLKK